MFPAKEGQSQEFSQDKKKKDIYDPLAKAAEISLMKAAKCQGYKDGKILLQSRRKDIILDFIKPKNILTCRKGT